MTSRQLGTYDHVEYILQRGQRLFDNVPRENRVGPAISYMQRMYASAVYTNYRADSGDWRDNYVTMITLSSQAHDNMVARAVEDAMRKYQEKIRRLTEDNSRLTEDNSRLDKENLRLKKEKKGSIDEIQRLTKERSDGHAFAKEIGDLKAAIAESTKEIGDLKAEQQRNKANVELEESRAATQAELALVNAAFEQYKQQTEAKLKGAKKAYDSIESFKKAYQKNIQSLKSTLHSKLAELNKATLASKGKIDALEAAVEKYKVADSKLVDAVLAQKAKLDSSQEELRELKTQNEAMKAQNETMTLKSSKEKAQFDSDLILYSQRAETLFNSNTALKKLTTNLTDEITKLTKTNTQLAKDNADLTNKLTIANACTVSDDADNMQMAKSLQKLAKNIKKKYPGLDE